MTDIAKMTFGRYRQLLASAHKGDDESALKVLSDLREAIESSDMDQDAINALCDLLTRALENKEARKRLIPEIPAKSRHIRERNKKIIELVYVASFMGCGLSSEGDAFEWAAKYYYQRHHEKVSNRNVRELWSMKNKIAPGFPSIGLQRGIRRNLARLIGEIFGAQGAFCPVYFGPNKVDLDLYASVANFPELEKAASRALQGLQIKTRNRKAFARAWLTACVVQDEIEI